MIEKKSSLPFAGAGPKSPPSTTPGSRRPGDGAAAPVARGSGAASRAEEPPHAGEAGKRTPVAELKEGQEVRQTFLVNRSELRTTRAGDSFVAADLQDRTGLIRANCWGAGEDVLAIFHQGGVVEVKARVESYNGALQLKVRDARPIDPKETDPADLLPATPCDVDQLWRDLEALAAGVVHPWVSKLFTAFLSDPEFASRFRRAPAAASMHHAYIGGLLEHTVSCMRLALLAADHYPEVERDLLLIGMFLHDVGKIDELMYDTSIGYSAAGMLLGHIPLGVELLRRKAGAIEGFPERLLDHLTHIILSHHNTKEFGSPVPPATVEALIIHYLECLDGKTHAMLRDRKRGQPDAEFSETSRNFNYRLYRGPSPLA
ncbi:MAG: HD domain-containing protein [Planctomycetes bacterium]|nr:HD domain-containing protein [Planctomycetota bacterium]